jgi:hypothetical protein
LWRILDAADTLDDMPRRCSTAKEDRRRPYKVRKLNVGGYLWLFTIVEAAETVWVIGFRQERMMHRPDDPPEEPPTVTGGDDG